LAKNKKSVYEMQSAAGIPYLTGQCLETPGTSDPQHNDTDLLIRLSKTSSIRGYSSQESDDSSEDAWNDLHWTGADWKFADQQAAKAKKSIRFGAATTKAKARLLSEHAKVE
jgi:hypothetical protein